jgi:Transglycosylase SLT domain
MRRWQAAYEHTPAAIEYEVGRTTKGFVLVSAAQKRRSADKEERRARRRRRKIAAATSTMALVAAAVAGEPVGMAAGPTNPALGAGGGLFGLTDPEDVSANGELGEDDQIGDEVLDSADDLDRLLQLAANGDLPNGQQGLPGVMAEAYRNAATRLAAEQPNCNLHWSLLASIGRIESHHAHGGKVDGAGNTVPNILGPVLNGGGFAAIKDTDRGRLDGDSRWDRAVGAMQFIPSTWRGYSSDGNNDGVSDPHNVWDATLAAGKYLCSGGMDLSDPRDVSTAVFRYNRSDTYVATVILWAEAYRNGTPILPNEPVDMNPSAQAMGPPSRVGDAPPKPAPKPSKPPAASKPPSGGSPSSPDGGPTSPTTTTPGRTSVPGSGSSTPGTRPTEPTAPCTPTSTTPTPTTTDSGAEASLTEPPAPSEVPTGAAGSAVSSTTTTPPTTPAC